MSIGIANEAALKLREASQSWTESTRPWNSSRPHQCGRTSLDNLGVLSASPGLLDIRVTGALESSGLDPMADLIRAQRLAAALVEASGSIPTSRGTWHGQSSSEMTSGDLVSGVDVGGTTIKAAVFDSDGLEYCRSERPTPGHLGPDAVIETTIHTIREQSGQVPEGRLRAWAWWFQGSWTPSKGSPSTPHIGWQQSPLRQIVAEAVGLPVILDPRRRRRAGRAGVGRGRRLAGGSLRCIEHWYRGGRDHQRSGVSRRHGQSR